ncbi:MAG: hypothetical protein PHW74_07365 [Desulfobacca sp.]|nr:hypothetical protein [Desulfobacca sp.]
MTEQHVVEVIVYDAPAARISQTSSQSCACGCGGEGHDHGCGCGSVADPLDRVSMELQTQALALTLDRAFPGQVKVRYINVLRDPQGPELPQTEILRSGAYPPPLVYINGQGRFAGGLPAERIREEVGRCLSSTPEN